MEYLKKTIPENAELLYRVGGHSKGGNLAAYGVMMCEERIQDRVIQIYMNDSPGFCPAILDEVRFSAIEFRIIKIVPAFSVIGMLFEKEAPKKIVRSYAEGIMQHDAITWQVDGNHFRYAEELTEKSKVYNEIFDHWIESAVLAKLGEGMEVYILAAGTYLTIGGMEAIGSSIFEEIKNDN